MGRHLHRRRALGRKQERDLAIEHVRLTSVGFCRRFGITLEVSGDGASLDEPQLVSLVRQAPAYRKTDGAVIEVGRISRLAVKLGEPVWAAAEDKTFCTPGAVELEDLAEGSCDRVLCELRARSRAGGAGRLLAVLSQCQLSLRVCPPSAAGAQVPCQGARP